MQSTIRIGHITSLKRLKEFNFSDYIEISDKHLKHLDTLTVLNANMLLVIEDVMSSITFPEISIILTHYDNKGDLVVIHDCKNEICMLINTAMNDTEANIGFMEIRGYVVELL